VLGRLDAPGIELLPLATALAVSEACERVAAVECRIKWPNDVWVEGRKLAGILIEARPQDGWAVVGVGLNLAIATEEFPPELRETATSLSSAPVAEDARAALDAALGRWVDAESEAVLAAWRERDVLHGRDVSWEGGSGVADGVSETGDLLVVTVDGDRVALGAGEVHLRL
jgi:BirA family biotin operon repressor/biotin-[acetyl-CoA-carboxylase] ligase